MCEKIEKKMVATSTLNTICDMLDLLAEKTSTENLIESEIAELKGLGVDDSDQKIVKLKAMISLLDSGSEIRKSLVKAQATSGSSDRLSYEGLNLIAMSADEKEQEEYLAKRKANGPCEFIVKRGDTVIFSVIFTHKLRVLLKRNADGGTTRVGSIPDIPTTRNAFLRKLKIWAEEEELNPGSFAKKYYAEDDED